MFGWISKKEKEEYTKLEKVIMYISTNNKLETSRTDFSTVRLHRVLKLLDRKYGLVENDLNNVRNILEERGIVDLIEKESPFGNKFEYIESKENYTGEGLEKEEVKILEKVLSDTRRMEHKDVMFYVYDEIEAKKNIQLTKGIK